MFGSHLSIAGSMLNALTEARELGLDTVQVFTKNQQQWKAKPLDPAIASDWRAEVQRLGWSRGCRSATGTALTLGRTVAHASYLANLAGPDDGLWRRSIDLMTDEIERCEALGIAFLVHHPGSYTTSNAEAGIGRIAAAYKELFARTRGARTICCLENTTGSGGNLGANFDQLALIRERIIEVTGEPTRVAFCIDTCHAHSAGNDLGSRVSAEAALDRLDQTCGLENVRVLHMNDSKAPMGSRRDLHEHIGQGTIGKGTKEGLIGSGFATVVNHPAFANVPKIMETPKGTSEGGTPWDIINLDHLRKLQQAPEMPIMMVGRPVRVTATRSEPLTRRPRKKSDL